MYGLECLRSVQVLPKRAPHQFGNTHPFRTGSKFSLFAKSRINSKRSDYFDGVTKWWTSTTTTRFLELSRLVATFCFVN
jgi:hypothetical protein